MKKMIANIGWNDHNVVDFLECQMNSTIFLSDKLSKMGYKKCVKYIKVFVFLSLYHNFHFLFSVLSKLKF